MGNWLEEHRPTPAMLVAVIALVVAAPASNDTPRVVHVEMNDAGASPGNQDANFVLTAIPK